MVVRFVCVVCVPLCVRVSRVSRVCPGSPRCLFTGKKTPGGAGTVPGCVRNHVYTYMYRPREGQVRRRDGLRSRLLLSRPPRPVRCSAWSTCACVGVSRFGSEVVCVIPRAPHQRFQQKSVSKRRPGLAVRTVHLAHVESSLRNNLLPILDPRAQSPAATPRLHRREKCRSRA